MSSKIDKTQPYASISGDDQGRVYEQNHKFYGADGNEWTDYSAPEPAQAEPVLVAKPVAAKAAGKKAPAAVPGAVPDADAQLAAQLEGGTD